ncbi:SusC/RagA family TonB-linked outer membrane protein [Bacteroidia bacterium]|nr:SusC/RagA family TonB-linked outer membrane protein [Bacteroidia bacterium]GHT02441.1 SusC/RagA family TonB-linked outer membrane protein [Bacteroidia bacterium]GHT49737.1 SusC/RagA family TonB-linked outer membrane protein [Bacteroidia bacterium]
MQVFARLPNSEIPGVNETQQAKQIAGKVLDTAGEALPGVTIAVKGTTNGTVTDLDGNFSLNNVADDAVLVFSYIGMLSQEVSVAGKSTINVTLEEDAIGLQEVVAIGYGVSKKSDLTGAVGTVKSDELLKRPITRIEQALQGTTPGVQVISSSGQPGKGLNVKIRGTNSITGGTSPLYVVDGDLDGDISSLNPNDIASMEILKDASATAIYGVRGSNGVVLITTKSGEVGRTKINVNAWFSKTSIADHIELMSAAEFAETINKYYVTTPAFSQADIDRLRSTGGTNWREELEESPWVQNYDVNVSGGNETVKYRVSYNSLYQPGMIITQKYNKDAVRANLDVKASKRLDLKFNLSYLETKSRNIQYQGDIYDPFSLANSFDPTLALKNDDGTYTRTSQWGTNGSNPVATILDKKDDKSNKRTSGTGVAVFKIIDGLTFTTNNTYTSASSYDKNWNGPYANDNPKNISASHSSSSSYHVQSSNYLTYDNTFGDHHLNGTLLYERSHGENVNFNGNAGQLSTPSFTYWNLGIGANKNVSSGYSRSALESYMWRVNYGYKDRYLLTAAYRADGSSQLADKWDYFPSVALAWNIAQENFLANHPVIAGLKLRTSYGETGNQAVGAYATIPKVDTWSMYFFDGITPITTTPMGTPVSKNLGWEHTKQTDIGLDVVLFNGRLSFTADLYNKDITGLLYDFRADPWFGGGTYKRNMGEMNNKGLELYFSGIPVKTRDFSWNSTLTVSFNRNKVVDLMGEDNLSFSGIGTFGAGVSRLMIGHPLGDFWGWKFLGTWKTNEATEAAKYGKKPGDPKYYDRPDKDGNIDYTINENDKMVIGNGTPDVSFGFINDFTYKNFTLSVMLQGMSGNEVYSQSMATVWGGHGMSRHATIKEALNVWSPENENDIPLLGREPTNFQSSRFVYDGSFIKLKNVALNYLIPKELTRKAYIENLEVYVSGQNLITFTKYPGGDPETNSATNAATQGLEMGVIPNPRTITFGFRLGF